MAEFVELSIQGMVPETEEMERIGLLSRLEIKKLIEKRRDFEYKISRQLRSKQDFVSYVLYDCKLLSLLKIRRKNKSVTDKFSHIEYPISHRVMKRLRFMTDVWPHDRDIWLLRISFLQDRKFYDEVSAAFSQQLRFHGDKVDAWIEWAQWEIKGRENFEKARTILLSRAPLYHPDSPTLNRELFRLELLFLEYLKAKAIETNIEGHEELVPENREEVLNCGIPIHIYEAVVKESGDPELFLQFYSIAQKFPFAHELQENIFNDLIELHPRTAVTWKLQAKRSLEALEKEASNKDDIHLLKIDKLFGVFDEALEEIGKPFLDCYIDEILRLLSMCWGIENLFHKLTSKAVFLFEKFANVLTAWQFLLWHDLSSRLKSEYSDLEKILEMARSLHPECYLLKITYFKLCASKEKNDQVIISEFKNTFGDVTASSCLEAWSALLDSLKKNVSKVAMFKEGIKHVDTSIAKALKSKYLHFRYGVSGLKASRTLYKNLYLLPPFSSLLHASMLDQELRELTEVSIKDVRNIFDAAIQQFGKKHLGVWLTYYLFEKKYGDGMRINTLKEEAEKTLKPKKYQRFVNLKYILDKTKGDSDKFFVMPEESLKKEEESYSFGDTVLCYLFAEAPTFTYSVNKERKAFFHSLVDWQTRINRDKVENIKEFIMSEDDETQKWEDLLTHLNGERVSLTVKESNINPSLIEEDATEYVQKVQKSAPQRRRRKFELSDELQVGKMSSPLKLEEGINDILMTSETLQPEFLQQKQIPAYHLGQRAKARIAKQKRNETKGKGWFDMKAPELTEETRRDLEVLKMRSILAPNRHYKRNDMKEMPKFFHFGKVLDSPLEHLGGCIPKKERKRTFAEELIHDEDILRYQKRRYTDIATHQEKRKKLRVSHQYAPKETANKKRRKKNL